MHDPYTLAHSIKTPWFAYKPWPKKWRRKIGGPHNSARWIWREMPDELKPGRDSSWPEGYRHDLVSVWHVDPERDGSDDSCGYSFVRLTNAQRERLWNAAWSEGQNPHYLRCKAKTWEGSLIDAELLYRGAVLLTARVLRLPMTFEEAARRAAEHTHIKDCFEAGHEFCFLPGYHTNFEKDSPEHRQEAFYNILCGIACSILTDRRPWWRHPKWHFWHWRFQVHPVQAFKRWAFSRCCKCGKGFRWGESVCTNSWHGKGPRWFRGEPNVYHEKCMNLEVKVAEAEPAATKVL